LAACGGGSASDGGAPPTQLPGPTPTPTPTPAPTPTTPIYPVLDYGSSFSLSSSLAYVVNIVEDPLPVFAGSGLLPSPNTSQLEFSQTTGSANILYENESVSFLKSDQTSTSPFLFYQKLPDSAGLGVNRINMPARYVTVADWRTSMHIVGLGVSGPGARVRTLILGTPSAASDPLPEFLGYNGLVSIRGGVRASETPRLSDISGGSQNVSWSYTPSNGRISGFVPLFITENSTQFQRGLLVASGQFDRATNSMSGTLSDSTNGFEGTFRGQMFGPERAELAVVFEFSRASDRSSYVGHFIGQR
jgi:hypothetical protein